MSALTPDLAREWLAVAVAEARQGLAEGGIPIGAALFGPDGSVWGQGHNRRARPLPRVRGGS